jgi:hypothetical protein
VYNLKPSNLGSCKRRILINRIESVTLSEVCVCLCVLSGWVSTVHTGVNVFAAPSLPSPSPLPTCCPGVG